MLGRNTDTYKYWKKEYNRYYSMPQNLDVINLGSSCDANNFDYSYWNLTGFNFASAPQDLYYDNQLLEQYCHRVKTGGIVFISLSEFALIVDKYNIEDHNYKYYWYLDGDRIDNYSVMKKKMLYLCPGVLDTKYIKQEIKDLVKRILHWKRKHKNINMPEMSQRMLNNWFEEFGWNENPIIRDEQLSAITRSWELILKDISICQKQKLTPIIVVPPFCEYLAKLMPEDLINECLWKYINLLKESGMMVMDFWNDVEFRKPDLYSTPILLNEKGKEMFNKKLQEILVDVVEDDDMREALKDNSEKLRNKSTYELQNGLTIPSIAFGTGVIKRFYRNKKMYYKDVIKGILISIKRRKTVRRLKNDITINSTLNAAVKIGYRLFDTGRLYGHSEQSIGKVINNYHRNDFFIVTKVSEDDLKRYPGASTVSDNLNISLKYLKTDYVDAYLLHFPTGDWLSTYKAIEKEYIDGRAKSIGVCNFDIEELKLLIDKSTIKPMICQVELNPLNTKRELRKFCRDNDIIVMAHTPTAHMDKRVVDSEVFQRLREKYNKTTAQIIYRWHYQNAVIPIVSSTSEVHMKENFDIFDFELSFEEMEKIERLDQGITFDKNNNKMNDCPDFIYNI